MGTYNLEILAYAIFTVDSPQLTVWNDGFLDTNHLITADGVSITRSLSFSGSLPSSVFFTFNDSSIELDRNITFRTLKINDRFINEENFLTTDVLVNGQASQVDMISGDFLFDDSDPSETLFSTPTITLDNNINSVRYLGSANYILDGLGGNDIFYLGGGNDQLYGNDGDDKIFSGTGNDLLFGGNGNDKLTGQDGDDELYGGGDADRLFGGNGADRLFGGTGNDKLYGNDGDDLIVGQDGNDVLNGSNGADNLYGDAGNDTLVGGHGNDNLDGGSVVDLIYGGGGDDIIYGGSGNDTIYADVGNDILHGNDGNNFLSGQAGNDTLYGGIGGKKSLSGGDGSDTLISMSNFTITSEINDILANNADVVYSADTNSFYKLFTGALTWTAAAANANSMFLTGLSGVEGNLTTITTQIENDFVDTLANGTSVWIGASDSTDEGEWQWLSGVENGMRFWTGGTGGSIFNNQYSSWAILSPASFVANQDYAYMNNAGNWQVDLSIDTHAYVVEWDAADLITLADPLTVMNGDAGNDNLYGQDGGIDRFIINDTDAVDDIFNFNMADHDQLHLLNIVNYNPIDDAIADFISFTEVAGDTFVAIDSDGAENGALFTDIARIDDVTGLDIALMIASDSLIV